MTPNLHLPFPSQVEKTLSECCLGMSQVAEPERRWRRLCLNLNYQEIHAPPVILKTVSSAVHSLQELAAESCFLECVECSEHHGNKLFALQVCRDNFCDDNAVLYPFHEKHEHIILFFSDYTCLIS